MGKYKILLGIVGIVLMFTQCNLNIEDDTIYIVGEGELSSYTLTNVDTFNLLTHAGLGNVNIITGESLEVEIIAQKNIFDRMQFEFENKHFRWKFGDKVIIEDADSIILNIKMPNPILGIQMIGTGNVNISGVKQSSLYFQLVGTGFIDCYGLELDEFEIKHQGVGDFRVWANNEIHGEMTGIGEIYYKGDPDINVNIIGTGVIIDDN